jgi:hypothetical protein
MDREVGCVKVAAHHSLETAGPPRMSENKSTQRKIARNNTWYPCHGSRAAFTPRARLAESAYNQMRPYPMV